jgi:hypothetical protein
MNKAFKKQAKNNPVDKNHDNLDLSTKFANKQKLSILTVHQGSRLIPSLQKHPSA